MDKVLVDMELAASTSWRSENFHPDYPEIQSLVATRVLWCRHRNVGFDMTILHSIYSASY